MRIAKASDHIAAPPFCIGVFLLHEGDGTETADETGDEIAVRQIAFQSRTLLALAIEQEHRRRPDRIKAVKPCRVFLNVSLSGRKFLRMNSAVF